MKKASGFQWSQDFNSYITAMTWGHGYGGEKFWQEEENWLKSYFRGKKVNKTISLGCGLFRELETLKSITSEEVTGLDYEEKFISYLQQNHLDKNDKKPFVKFVQGDVQQLGLNDNGFDLAVMLFSSLGLIPDMDKALKEMYRITRKNGHIVISSWQDNERINQFRAETYINSKPNREFRIEYNAKQAIDDIVIYENGEQYFRAGILTKDYLTALIHKNLRGVKLEFHDLTYCRMLVISLQ